MKKLLYLSLIALIFPISVNIYSHYIVGEKPEVVVSSTPIISTSFTNPGNSDFLKTYTITNEGNKVAQQVLFKISERINNYQIIKSSLQDTVKVAESGNKLEIIYDTLPPTSEFTIMLLLDHDSPAEPFVGHLNGIAVKASSDHDIITYGNVFLIVCAVIYLLLSLRILLQKNYSISSLSVINKGKPWYINPDDFESMIESSLPNILQPISAKFKNSFNELNTISKKEEIDQINNSAIASSVRDTVIKYANKIFLIESQVALSVIDDIESIEEYTAYDKPSWITPENWKKHQENILRRATRIAREINETQPFKNKATAILSSLKKGQIGNLEHNEYSKWSDAYKYGLKCLLVNEIATDKFFHTKLKLSELSSFIEFLDDRDQEKIKTAICIHNVIADIKLPSLSINKKDDLKKTIDSAPTWADNNFWPVYVSILKTALENLELQETSEKLIPKLTHLLELPPSITKVSAVEKLGDHIERLDGFNESLKEKGYALQKKESEVAALESEANSQVVRLRQQLQLIDATLKGDKAIEKEEYPEKIFTKENVKTLKTISEVINSQG